MRASGTAGRRFTAGAPPDARRTTAGPFTAPKPFGAASYTFDEIDILHDRGETAFPIIEPPASIFRGKHRSLYGQHDLKFRFAERRCILSVVKSFKRLSVVNADTEGDF